MGQGGFKQQKKGDHFVKGIFLEGISAKEQAQILKTQQEAYDTFVENLPEEEQQYLCLPEIVSYISAKTGKIKTILLAPYMNQRDLWGANQSIPKQQWPKILLQIAKGVKAMHDCEFAHLDIKEDNVLVNEENGVFTAKLTDFDLMQNVEDEEEPRASMQEDIRALGEVFYHVSWQNPVAEEHKELFNALTELMRGDDPNTRPTIDQLIPFLERMQAE